MRIPSVGQTKVIIANTQIRDHHFQESRRNRYPTSPARPTYGDQSTQEVTRRIPIWDLRPNQNNQQLRVCPNRRPLARRHRQRQRQKGRITRDERANSERRPGSGLSRGTNQRWTKHNNDKTQTNSKKPLMVGHRHIRRRSQKENQRPSTDHPEVKSQRIHHQTRPGRATLQTSMGYRHSGSCQLRPPTPTRKVHSHEMTPKRRKRNKTNTAELLVCPRHHPPSDEKKTPSKTREGIESHQTRTHRV
jgi:hypothetical protein